MSQTEDIALPKPSRKRRSATIIMACALAISMATAGFFLTSTNKIKNQMQSLIGANGSSHLNVSFVKIDPININLKQGSTARHLRFLAQLEVVKEKEQEVIQLIPRVIDILNGYLRAVEIEQLENPSAFVRIKAQMLRRAQIVSGEGRINDILITEFIIN